MMLLVQRASWGHLIVRTMRTTAFWTLYVGITILIGSVCHYHTAVEGRPGKSPAGKTVGKYLKVFPANFLE